MVRKVSEMSHLFMWYRGNYSAVAQVCSAHPEFISQLSLLNLESAPSSGPHHVQGVCQVRGGSAATFWRVIVTASAGVLTLCQLSMSFAGRVLGPVYTHMQVKRLQ